MLNFKKLPASISLYVIAYKIPLSLQVLFGSSHDYFGCLEAEL